MKSERSNQASKALAFVMTMFVCAVALRFLFVLASLSAASHEPSAEAVSFFALALAHSIGSGLLLYALLRPKPGNPFFPSVFVLSTSLGTTMLTTWILYLSGLYTTAAAAALEVVFAGAGLWGAALLCVRRLRRRKETPTRPRFCLPLLSPAECLALLVSLLFCAGMFECVAGSPMTAWDAVVSWDKWATDIAARSALGGYISGAYPQGLPLLLSLFYKLLPQGDIPALSAAHLLASGFLQVFPLLLCLSLLSAARSLKINPLWPLGVVLANAGVLHCIIKFNGYADIPLAASVAAALAVSAELFAARRLSGRRAAAVLTAVLFPVAFVKGNGVALLLLALPLLLIPSRRPKAGALPLATGAALLLAGVFYLHQWIAGVWTNLGETTPFNHSLVVVATHSDLVRHNLTDLLRQITTWCGFYGLTGKIAVIFGSAIGVVSLLGMLFAKRTRPAGILSLAIILFWLMTGSYDARNLVFVIPVIALGVPLATASLLSAHPALRSTVTAAFILLCAFSATRTRLPEIARRPLAAYSAPEMIRLSPAQRQARLLKATESELAFFTDSAVGQASGKIITPSESYRYFPGKGIYPLQKNGQNDLARGDIAFLAFAGATPLFTPKPPFEKVSSVRKGFKAGVALYLYAPELSPAPHVLAHDGAATTITLTSAPQDSGFISVVLDAETPATLELLSDASPTHALFASCQDGAVVRLMYWTPGPPGGLAFRLTTSTPANIRKVELGH